ncbi:MAG: ATP-dependent zinc metalloprotease FtsH [Chromatiaceae bacterium]
MDYIASWMQDDAALVWLPLLVIVGLFAVAATLAARHRRPTPSDPKTQAPRQSEPPGPQQPQGPPSMMWMWWLVLIALLAWDFSGAISQRTAPPVAKLPYSVFVDQLKAGNVSQVAIQGSEIAGMFKHSRLWNPRTGLLASQPAKAGQETSAPSTAPAAKSKTAPEAPPAPGSSAKPQPAKTSAPAGATKTEVEQRHAAPPPPKPVEVKDFTTVFPSSVGDPELLPLLEQNGVEIVATPQGPHWLGDVLGALVPTLLLVGFLWWMGRRAMNQQQSIFGVGKSQARRFHKETSPAATFDDVAGADGSKAQLQEIVEFLKAPERFQTLGARIPRGVLLVGPPGTGKTLLARAVAGEAGVPFFSISGSEFVEMFVGVGASRVRALFKEVKEAAPAILFVDELDAVGRRRGAGVGMVNDEREQTLNQLLVEMDGFDARQSIIVLAATNRPDVLDPALRRPGRFDRDVVVGLPDLRGRRGILDIHVRKLTLADDVNLDHVAALTMGMSGAQLANLCNEAALFGARRGHKAVTQSDFDGALDKIVLGEERPLALNADAKRVIAYHEGGHALVAWLTPEADPVHKVTIIPHGFALGVTEQRPDEEQYNLSRSYLLARLAVMLGGRASEEVAFGDVTTGAENDLKQATELARRMVTTWGMSELGLSAYESAGEDRFLGYELGRNRTYSEETARRIDKAVHDLLEDGHQHALRLLKEARDRLDRLAGALLDHETVAQEELTLLLGPRLQVQAPARTV